MLGLGFGFWGDWELRDKVTFNMFARVISVNPGVTEIDVQIDVYSAWKRWAQVDDNNKIGVVVRAIGGDPTVGLFKAGDIYFLVNGWRLQVDLAQTSVQGSLFSDDFATPLIDFSGAQVFQSFVSNLVTGVAQQDQPTVPSALDIAQQVWDLQATLAQLEGSVGVQLSDIVKRLDLNTSVPNTYDNDGSLITNSDFTLTKTDNGNGTSTVQRS